MSAFTHRCDVINCWGGRAGIAVEMHFRICGGVITNAWPVCERHLDESRKLDRSWNENTTFSRAAQFLYLPIIQPVVGSYEALCVEFILTRFCEVVWGALHEEQMRAIGAEVAA